MKKIVRFIVISVSVISIMTFSGCNTRENPELDFDGKLQEIPLPTDANIISDLKVNDEGNVYIASMRYDEDKTGSIANIWRLNKDKKWDRVFEKKFLSDNSKNSEALISFIGDKAIISNYIFYPDDIISGSENFYRIDDIEGENATKVFEDVEEYSVSDFCGMRVDAVFGIDSRTANIINLDFINGKMNVIEELSDVYSLESRNDSAYLIYKQKYELTDEEIAELNPTSDYPSKYARGIIYNLNDGHITESSVLDRVAIRFFEKWHKGGENTYNFLPIFYPSSDSKAEAYYLAHNDGVYKIDDSGETLIYYDDSWDSEDVQLTQMVVTPSEDIYLCVYFYNLGTEKLFKITQ